MDRFEDRLDRIEREIDSLSRELGATGDPEARRILGRRLPALRRRVREIEPDPFFSRPTGGGIRAVLRATDSYGFVLVLISVLIWVLVPAAAGADWLRLPTAAVFCVAVTVSLHTSVVRRDLLTVIAGVVVGLFALIAASELFGNATLRALGDIGYGVLLAGTAAVVLRRVLSHRVVTSRTLSGAVAVYLLAALAFASLFSALEALDPGAFSSDEAGTLRFPALLYFSLVTLTTVGYGDIEPVTGAARALATLEAVVGSVYLVIIVARLVSLYGAAEEAEQLVGLADDTPGDGDDGDGDDGGRD